MSYSFDVNSTKLVERIRDEQSVLLVAGDWYGMDKYLRFGYGAKREHLIKALELSDKVFKTL
jgi:aspartate/methionine/tyrosine aminotransferase